MSIRTCSLEGRESPTLYLFVQQLQVRGGSKDLGPITCGSFGTLNP